MDKVFDSFQDAIRDVHDGATLIVGGFGLCRDTRKFDH